MGLAQESRSLTHQVTAAYATIGKRVDDVQTFWLPIYLILLMCDKGRGDQYMLLMVR
jgi:hypothetical protein